MLPRVLEESRAKHLDREGLRGRLERAARAWPGLRTRVRDQLPPYPELRSMLAAGGCPVCPEQVNLTRERVCRTVAMAQKIRNRYTVLDLAYETGLLQWCIDELRRSPVYLR